MPESNVDTPRAEPSVGDEIIRPGRHNMLVESPETESINGGSEYVQITFVALDGQYKGRKVFARLLTRTPTWSSLAEALHKTLRIDVFAY